MKKMIALLLLLSLGGMQNSFCQADKKHSKAAFLTYYGFAGINSSSIVGDDKSYKGGLVGFEAGLGGPVVGFTDQFGLAAELMYATRGAKYSDEYVGDGKVLTSYIMLPIFARYSFGKTIYGELGLQPGVLLSARDKYDGNSDDFKDAMNSFDLPAFIGAGAKFTEQFGAGLRYSRGITNIVKSSYGDAKDYNSAISLRLMYFFGAGTK